MCHFVTVATARQCFATVPVTLGRKEGRKAGVDAAVDALIVLQLTSAYHGVLSGLELIVAQLESLAGDYIT
jgi:hypothetical protein